MQRVTICSIPVTVVSMHELMQSFLHVLEGHRQLFVATVNAEFILESTQNAKFQLALQKSDISTIDGISVIAAHSFLEKTQKQVRSFATVSTLYFQFWFEVFRVSFLKHVPVVYGEKMVRVSGIDLIWVLISQEWMNGRRVYLLGGKNHVAARAAKKLQALNPRVQFRFSNGFSNIRLYNKEEEERVIGDIALFQPDVLLVAYGHPFQETWLYENREKLGYGIGIGVGGSFDFIAGDIPRAPVWMRRMGLEWLYRLIRQPSRWPRIMNATFGFAALIVRERLH